MISEASKRAAGMVAEPAEEAHGVVSAGDADQRRRLGARPRHQRQRHFGDDAQRALAADDELFDVVTFVRLRDELEVIHHPSVRQHDLQAQDTRWRVTPWRNASMPPALVDTMPPMVALSRAARSMPTA